MPYDNYTVRLADEQREAVSDWADERGIDDSEAFRQLVNEGLNGADETRMGTFLGWLAAVAVVWAVYLTGAVLVLNWPHGTEAVASIVVALWLLAAWGAYITGQYGITVREAAKRAITRG